MNEKELTRLKILDRVIEINTTPTLAAIELGLSRSQFYRLLQSYRTHGVSALQTKKRGRISDNAKPAAFREHIIDLVRTLYSDFGPSFAAEKLQEKQYIAVNAETLRLWMIEAGLWRTRRERRKQVHQPRQRRDCYGELVIGPKNQWVEK